MVDVADVEQSDGLVRQRCGELSATSAEGDVPSLVDGQGFAPERTVGAEHEHEHVYVQVTPPC